MSKSTIAIFLCIFILTGCIQNEMKGLKKEIENELAIPGAHFGVALKDIQTGNTLLLNEKENFHAASTMKTPVLAELFKQASDGRFLLTDSIPVKNSFSSIADGSTYTLNASDDSDRALYRDTGNKKTIAALAGAMITKSSNLATNLLIEMVTPDSVMQTMKSIGANDIRVLRGVEDGKAYERGLNNTTTAYDLLLIFEKMADEKLISASASKQMIDILLGQEFNEIIPALLPPNVKIAHKTGSITGIQHDSGIVFLPDGRRYVLVLLSRFNPADEKKVINAMAKVSKDVYDYIKIE